MNRIEYKEGIIWCGEEKASNQLSTLVACLSAQSQEDEARQQLYSGNRSYRKSKYQMA